MRLGILRRTFNLATAEVLPLAHVFKQLLRGAADVNAHRKTVGFHPTCCENEKNVTGHNKLKLFVYAITYQC